MASDGLMFGQIRDPGSTGGFCPVCVFPGCGHPAPLAVVGGHDDAYPLCFEHDAQRFYDPPGFHQEWEQREPEHAAT
jgi:hypothetical protein